MADGRKARRMDLEEEPDGPLRQCAVSRVERPLDELIRFVADPTGEILADGGRRLPGRGVWVTAEKQMVAEAVKSKAFAKSLKRQISVAADLPERVEALLLRRALDALSLANKAGSVTPGFAQVESLIEKGSVVLLLHAADAADGGCDKLDRKFRAIARDRGLSDTISTVFTIEQMSLAMGRSNVVHAALIKGGATKKLLSEAGRLERYRQPAASIQLSQPPPIPEV